MDRSDSSKTRGQHSPVMYKGKRVTLNHDEDVSFLAIDLLYNESVYDIFGDHQAFIISTCHSKFPEKNYILKLEATVSSRLNNAKMIISHQVEPKLGNCTRIFNVDDHRKLATFDSGFVTPISDFGYGRNFHFDVRGSVRYDFVDGGPCQVYYDGEKITCWVADQFKLRLPNPKDITSMCVHLNSETGTNYVIFGTSSGELLCFDLGEGNQLWIHKEEESRPITRVKAYSLNNGTEETSDPMRDDLVVFCNSTSQVQVLKLSSGELDPSWQCDRDPKAEQLDFVMHENRIVTCGRSASIGCWFRVDDQD